MQLDLWRSLGSRGFAVVSWFAALACSSGNSVRDTPASGDAGIETPGPLQDAGPVERDAGAIDEDAATPPREDGGPTPPGEPDGGSTSGMLRVSEVMANNEGAWIDEFGEADDWVELINAGTTPIDLTNYEMQDQQGNVASLPNGSLAPGATLLLWADDEPAQGERHLPFKIGSDGDHLTIFDPGGRTIESVEVVPLSINEALGRFPSPDGDLRTCRYVSPGRPNPDTCTPPAPPSLEDVFFEPFQHPFPYPITNARLVISELALRPAGFIELLNTSSTAIALDDYQLWLSPTQPGAPWPENGAGTEIAMPSGVELLAGERISIDIAPASTSELEEDPLFEGVLTLFERDGTAVVDRIDFMSWPEDAALSRFPDANGTLRYCTNTTPGEPNDCTELASRPVGDRLRALRTPGDFAALAAGDPTVGIDSVKFVIDLQAGGVVHLLGSARWPLHYTFVREQIYLEPALDRCDPEQDQLFYQGWVDFSVSEYFQVEGRRFLLGTLSHHGGADLKAVEYTFGDAISPAQMQLGYYSVLPHTEDPSEWVLRAQDEAQVEKVRDIEGTLPLVGPNAPFVDVDYQPLTEGVSYGTLRFIPASELETASFHRTTIVVTDDVPNDIPFVAGLITEAFQTPLAHVNVLSQARNTPNAALRAAREDPRVRDHLDQLVRLEVNAGDIVIEPATAEEVSEFWEARAVEGPVLSPRLDTSSRGVQPLSEHTLESLPAIGAKAAQMSELLQVVLAACSGTAQFQTPASPFAIPVVHSLEHFEASGARELLDSLRENPEFEVDTAMRNEGLAQVRQLILEGAVDPALLDEVTNAVQERFGNERVRFRSSSNTEDLPSFNGAGLYTSISAELDDPERTVADAIRTVWASLWNARAYDERSNANIDDSQVAMGVLVHPAFLSEEANGVAVSRNILDPNRGDIYYINVQAGEASVTNPAPGVATDQLIYRLDRSPTIEYYSESSLLSALASRGEHVMTDGEAYQLRCALEAVHDWFRPLLDPDEENRWFAMEVEFKLIGENRDLLIKQARPHSFGTASPSTDCREF